MISYVLLGIALVSFFLFRLLHLSIRLSDTNIYFYTGYQLLHGKLLYADIFFTNFPFFAYISSFYFILVGGVLPLFYLTATLEVMIVAVFIYFITIKKTRNSFLSLLSSLIYCFSFLVLTTSDHQTGVFASSIFALLAYYFYENNPRWSGFFSACMLLIKAYFTPVLLAIVCGLLIKKRTKSVINYSVVFLAVLLVASSYFVLISHGQIITDIFAYSLTRSEGIEKLPILWFFVSHDFLFFLIFITSIIFIRRFLFFGLVSIFGLLFFLFYKDMYYLYLNFLMPFLALAFSEQVLFINKKFSLQRLIIPTFALVLLTITITLYLVNYQNLGKLNNTSKIVRLIKKEHPSALYGVNDITPALAYLSSTKLLNNIVDTNENIFRKGYLDAHVLTRAAITKHALLVSHGAEYPELGIRNDLLDAIFDKALVKTHCRVLSRYPVTAEGSANRIVLFTCN